MEGNLRKVSDLTVDELLRLVRAAVASSLETEKLKAAADGVSEKYAYGIPGIANLLGCSETTAKRIKRSGVIDKAIRQQGRVIVVDKEMALRLWGAQAKTGRA